MHSRTAVILSLLAAGSIAGAAVEAPPAPRPQIEVCFVLDTTGSMSGLIEGAKRKIWSIANDIALAEPTPAVKMGLIGYRDRGDEYVTRVYELTDNIDSIYEKLQGFRAQGGGDTPESVNLALHEAATKMNWSTNRSVYKVIFLVGDAPPHMDYKQEKQYPEICEAAVRRDLVINTVQCGNMAATVKPWTEIADRSEGSYVAIGQGGDMIVVETPMDKEIATLRASLGDTRWSYGAPAAPFARALEMEKTMAAKPAPDGAARASFMAKKEAAEKARYGAGEEPALEALADDAVAGRADLLDALEHKAVKLDDLDEEKLPDELKRLDRKEREAYIEKKIADRKEVEAKLLKLTRERDEYLAEERRKSAGKKDGFDAQVGKFIREQAKRKGIVYPD
jgi:Mg-chelatase subunit ChlD